MIVAGGIYREVSTFPGDDQLYGSAGRAASVLASLTSEDIHLHSYVGKDFLKEVELRANNWKVNLHTKLIERTLTFKYYHGLSTPNIQPLSALFTSNPSIQATAELVLRFGMLEGDAVVHAKTAIFDPQNPQQPDFFDSNGSTAERLAYVLNRGEALSLTGKETIDDAAAMLMNEKNANVVVIKSGAFGAIVYNNSRTKIHAYETKQVWPIGSGDVFAAVFSYYWGEKNLEANEAAECASRAAAVYCDTKLLQFDKSQLESKTFIYKPLIPKRTPDKCLIYIAGPFFTMSQYWLVSEARDAMLGNGYKVFSPVHDVGIGTAEEVVEKDLDGLRESQVVLALCDGLDSGTLFEVGYAVNENIPVVAFAEQTSDESMKMLEGTGCLHFRDFTTAIYHAQWKALTQ